MDHECTATEGKAIKMDSGCTVTEGKSVKNGLWVHCNGGKIDQKWTLGVQFLKFSQITLLQRSGGFVIELIHSIVFDRNYYVLNISFHTILIRYSDLFWKDMFLRKADFLIRNAASCLDCKNILSCVLHSMYTKRENHPETHFFYHSLPFSVYIFCENPSKESNKRMIRERNSFTVPMDLRSYVSKRNIS